jgi:hypothetical protein
MQFNSIYIAGIVEGAETVGEESRYALKDLVTMF